MRSKKTKLLLMIEILESSKTLLSENTFRKESITLKGHGKTIADNKKIAETFNNSFSNIVKNLNIDSDSDITSQTNNADPVFRDMLIIQAY